MRTGPVQRRTPRRAAAVILATATLSMALVAVTGSPSAAEQVNTSINVSCGARDNDRATVEALNLAATLLGSNRLNLTMNITAADIPPAAGLDEEIDARFVWNARLDQNLIDGAAALIPSINITNASGTMLVNGPSSVPSFNATAPDVTVRPVAGRPANVNLGTYGGPITTTGGGIITYRVGNLQFDAALNVTGVGSFDLKLRCNVQGSNLIARTTVRDPDAPIFDPEVLNLDAAPGETVQVNLLEDIIQEGATPLMEDTLEIVESPAAGTASLDNGTFTFQSPQEPGTYSTTVQVCGEPKPDDEGIPGVSEEQTLFLGANWTNGFLAPRPVAFSLKVGDEGETPLIWTVPGRTKPLLLGAPTPENWAPENRAGLVNEYALLTDYVRPTASQIRGALEAVPAIGPGNVEVEEIFNDAERLTGFKITYVNERAEQNMPNVSLGQWYGVPPQEVLDRLLAAATGLLGGDDDDGDATPPPPPFDTLNDPDDPAQQRIADDFIGGKVLQGILNPANGPSPAEWDAYLDFRIVQPIISAAPEIIAFISGLFPAQVEIETTVEGEEPTPPQPLCAQGIIDVTVAEVQDETEGPGDDTGAGVGDAGATEVGGIQQTNGGGAGIGFVG